MRAVTCAAAVVVIAGAAKSEPCDSSLVNLTVANRKDADYLSEALQCTGSGAFEVVWNGTVQVARSMVVRNGSFLNVTGSSFLSPHVVSRVVDYCSLRVRHLNRR